MLSRPVVGGDHAWQAGSQEVRTHHVLWQAGEQSLGREFLQGPVQLPLLPFNTMHTRGTDTSLV